MTQQIIVILIVAAAIFYIGRMLWGTVAGKGGCHNCSAHHVSHVKSKKKSATLPQHLVQMQTTLQHHEKNNRTAKPN
jgi:hypothetical protein